MSRNPNKIDRKHVSETIVVIRNKLAEIEAVGMTTEEAWSTAAGSVGEMVALQYNGFYAQIVTIVLLEEV